MAVSVAGSEFDDEGDFAETHEAPSVDDLACPTPNPKPRFYIVLVNRFTGRLRQAS
mgnify:CR=1 FL=1